jgi:hypothetical protein
MIQTSNGQGTGFTIDVDGRQYLITARHLVNGMGPQGTVQIGKFGSTATSPIAFDNFVMQIFRCPGSIDIAVLVPPAPLTVVETMVPVDSSGFFIGQNAYFVGFPLGMHSQAKTNPPRPIGFVKQGMISGVQYEQDGDGDLIFLDGYNVFGFSGSPVTYWEPQNDKTPARSYVIGVISGFTADSNLVVVPKEIKPSEVKPSDRERGRILELPGHVYKLEEKKVNGKKTNEMVMMNTGIVRSYGIESALKLIHQHPIGPLTSGDKGPN